MHTVAPAILFVLGVTLVTTQVAQGIPDEFNRNGRFAAPSKKTERNVDTVQVSRQYIRQGKALRRISSAEIPPLIPQIDYSTDDDRNFLDVVPEFASIFSASEPAELNNLKFWSRWTAWTSCSRSCGGGVSKRSRTCAGRSSNDITAVCDGPTNEYIVCNPQKCPEEAQDFRELQCSQQNENIFRSRRFTWIPYSGSDFDPCDLSCIAEGYNSFHKFGTVLDGTRCGINGRDMCIDGQCMRVGCDMIVGSNLTEDACGFCGGSNGTCFHYKNTFGELHSNSAKDFDYNEVAKIPVGATHIVVKDYTKNYMALLEGDEHFEKYIINGNWVVSWPGKFKTAGTVVTYDRDDDKETFEISGPTTKELYIMILFLGYQPIIEYEYWIPNSLRPSGSPQFSEFRLHESSIQIPTEEDYYDQIYAAGLDFDSVVPPKHDLTSSTTSKPTTTTRKPTTIATTVPTTTVSTTTRLVIAPEEKKKNEISKKPATAKAKHDHCTPCKRSFNKKRHFCESDFVIHARIISKRRVQRGRYVRYDIELLTTYKSVFKMMRREYVWVSSACCPKLRPYRHYLLMGRKVTFNVGNENNEQELDVIPENAGRYETRLIVDYTDYWHPWRKSYEVRMSKISNHINCKRYRYQKHRQRNRNEA